MGSLAPTNTRLTQRISHARLTGPAKRARERGAGLLGQVWKAEGAG